MQIHRLTPDSPQYPESLAEIDNRPQSLNVLGILPKGRYIAIVGTRSATSYGERITHQLATELAKAGAIIVSGLAIGIDGIAQRAALEAGGRTIAVLAHGLDRIYPSRHRTLAKHILATGGALVSEYDEGEPPLPFRFVERNRIIAGLCEITIVTESAAKGGSLITARDALQANRSVMAVPGNITSKYSAGTNNLIRTGQAAAITSSSDVMAELGFIVHETQPVPAQSADEARLLDLLRDGVSTTQQLIDQSQFSAAQFANIISLMEITGKVRNLGSAGWAIR